ncbi:MAG: ABC transporter ATP-binding protein [Clostridia bacterium]|nr:ABC transporter ATP-binding protein [Clostridia bacterium]
MIQLLKYLKKIKGPAAAAMVFAVLSQLGSLVLPLLMSMIVNNGIKNEDTEYIKKIGIIMMCVSAFAVIIAAFNSYFSSKTSALYGKMLRRELFLKVESLSQRDIDIIGTPSLITRCTNDVRVFQDFILQGLRMIISAPIMLVGGIVMAFIMNPTLSMIIFAVMPIIGIIVAVVLKIVMPIFRKRQKLVDSINRFIREKLAGIRVIRAFNRSEFEDARFDKENEALSALTLKFQRLMSVLIPTCIVLIITALDILIICAAKSIDKLDHITQATELTNSIGNLQAFVVYMIMIVFSFTMAAAMFVIVPRARISAKRIVEVLSLEPSVKDKENVREVEEDKKGTVEFRNVTFGYESVNNPAVRNISFTAEKNKVTAIIGGTGSGKSTIINLITRFYDVNEGQVLFDGVDVRDLRQADLHKRIGYVSQKACLFSGSIKENLLYGDENASDERLRKAVEISQSAEFIDKMPDGIDSFVSQSGTNLSGGQKQRLSIARALTRDAELYIFDDTFSALDFKTDAALRRAIKDNINATVIIVAQRVGTIIDADKIIVMDKGEIVGTGKHCELMENCDVYKEIYSSQIQEEVGA